MSCSCLSLNLRGNYLCGSVTVVEYFEYITAPAPRPFSSKPPSSELKPEKLTHDASASTFQTWKKQFRAYFDSAQLGTLPCSQQQAFFSILLTHEGSDREAYRDFQPSLTSSAGGAKG